MRLLSFLLIILFLSSCLERGGETPPLEIEVPKIVPQVEVTPLPENEEEETFEGFAAVGNHNLLAICQNSSIQITLIEIEDCNFFGLDNPQSCLSITGLSEAEYEYFFASNVQFESSETTLMAKLYINLDDTVEILSASLDIDHGLGSFSYTLDSSAPLTDIEDLECVIMSSALQWMLGSQ